MGLHGCSLTLGFLELEEGVFDISLVSGDSDQVVTAGDEEGLNARDDLFELADSLGQLNG